MNTSKGSERINEEGNVEIKVDSVDYRSPAGYDKDDKPVKEKVEVTHVIDPKTQDPASNYANPGEALSSRVNSAKPSTSKQEK
ncbi:hypothetical protein HanXRQr2_Chr02g0054311 [Helianthus annuus]|uniref:Uncharacterized protein n=1 Tax=Helianthus annuus TaxID=4232 RepID=A0A251TMS1_HELAN|nr:uncharacterized protein LOC110886233 [Helianthus annuus]KAF5817548.1 hypothetical protein HanXRQr2_Chr02g0054311 [Helianthus annuus]